MFKSKIVTLYLIVVMKGENIMTTETPTKHTNAPYIYDHVGSFLRPDALREARLNTPLDQQLTDADFELQQQAIKDIVEKQVALGYKAITDGEFSRKWFHADFLVDLEGVDFYLSKGYGFEGVETTAEDFKIGGKISFNPNHPFFKSYLYLQDLVKSYGDSSIQAKQTIPAPSFLIFDSGRTDEYLNGYSDHYTNRQEFLDDLAQAYIDTALHFYELGNRYLQIDDVPWANIAQHLATSKDPEERAKFEQYAEEIIYVNNKISDALPEDYTFTTHICRGNFRSTWLFTGGYDSIASFLGRLHVDGLFLEFDDERSGDFEKLGDIWNGDKNKKLVLGLITTKNSDLENKNTIKARLADAATHVPLENLTLSPQCGFASTVEGNDVSSDSQWAKLNLIKEIAQEVWK